MIKIQTWTDSVNDWLGGVASDVPYLSQETFDILDRTTKLVPSIRNFRKFMRVVEKCPGFGPGFSRYTWPNDLFRFMIDLDNGAFKKEFKYKAHKSRNTCQYSQVRSLFDLFQQALHYNKRTL